MTVKLYKLTTGEEIIAKVVSETADQAVLTDVVRIVYHPTQDGRMSAGFAPYLPYSEGNITLYTRAVGAIAEVKSDMLDEYNRIFSNIVIAPASILS